MADESLMAKLKGWLGQADAEPGGATPAPAPAGPAPAGPAPAHAAPVDPRQAKLDQLEHVAKVTERLARAIADPMALLASCCDATGLLPGRGRKLSTAMAPHAEAVRKLIGGNPEAAKLVVLLVTRYYDETQVELELLRAALADGQVESVSLEQAKGRFYYLAKVGLMVRAYPILAQLFPAAQAEAAAPARGTGALSGAARPGGGTDQLELSSRKGGTSGLKLGVGPVPARTPTGPLTPGKTGPLGGPGAPPTGVGRPAAAGPAPAGAAAGKPAVPAGPAGLAQGRRMVERLNGRIHVCTTALAIVGKRSLPPPPLPHPGAQMAQKLAAMLANNAELAVRLRGLVSSHQQARKALEAHQGEEVPAQLKGWLLSLNSLAIRYRSHPLLVSLFTVTGEADDPWGPLPGQS